MKGSVSQNFDTGLSFCFIVFRRWKSEKNKKYKKLQKLPVFCHKLKLRPKKNHETRFPRSECFLYTQKFVYVRTILNEISMFKK